MIILYSISILVSSWLNISTIRGLLNRIDNTTESTQKDYRSAYNFHYMTRIEHAIFKLPSWASTKGVSQTSTSNVGSCAIDFVLVSNQLLTSNYLFGYVSP